MKNSHYFKLGLFVLSGIALLTAAVFVVGSRVFFEHKIHAETLMDESVDGLEEGAPVKYRGVTIGQVKSISFAAESHDTVTRKPHGIARYVLVEMSLESKSFERMSLPEIQKTLKEMAESGLRARVEQQGIGGGVYVGLDFVNATVNPPPQVHLDSTALYIPSAPSTMNQVMSAAERLANDLRQANLPQVVEHIDHLVTSANGTVGQIHQLVEGNQGNLKSALTDLPDIMHGLKGTVTRTDELLKDKKLDRTISNMADASAGAGEAVGELRRASQDLSALISTRQEDFNRIISDLRRTADNLAVLSNDARDNPSQLILGGPPPRRVPAGH